MIGRLLGEARGIVEREITVHLVGRDVMEAQIMLARRLQERERALDVRSQKRRRVEDGVVIMALGGKVHDRIGICSELVDELGIADIAMHEGHAVLRQTRYVVRVTRIGKRIKHRDMHARLVFDDPMHEVAADKAGATRDDDILGDKRIRHALALC